MMLIIQFIIQSDSMTSIDSHYLAEVAALSQTSGVFAAENIFNAQGLKLLAEGESISQKAADIIVTHKLAKPIDMTIRIANAITPERLVSHMEKLLGDSNRLITTALHRKNDIDRLLSTLHHGVKLNILLTNKLSVMEKRRPELLYHSLEVAATAMTLGSLCQLSWGEQQHLVVIGLLHDIGVLHLDPELSNPNRKLSPEDWHHMQSHPAIAFMMLKQFPNYHPHISLPILEHHERLDGSGYPRRLKSNGLSKLGKIAAIAEIIMGVVNKDSMDHLEVVLKSLYGKLDSEAVNALHDAAFRFAPQTMSPIEDLSASFSALSEILSSWNALEADKFSEKSKFLTFLAPRMKEIQKMIYEAGNMTDPYVIATIQSDPEASNEAYSLMQESLYQIDQALSFAYIAGDDIDAIKPQASAKAIKAWLTQVPALIKKAKAYALCR